MKTTINKIFIKDLSMPIAVYLDPYFDYLLNLIDPYYNSISKYELLKKEVELNGLKEFEENNRKTMFKLLDKMKEHKGYETFNNLDYKTFQSETKIQKRVLYQPNNVGKSFFSIDLVQANFQCLLSVVPEIFDGFDNYDDFVTANGFNDYMKISKQIRQVIFGNLNPKKQQSVQKSMMNLIADKLFKNGVDLNSIHSLSSDEIVFECNDFEKVKIQSILSELDFNLRIEKFTLERPFKQAMYVKKLDNSDVIFKMVSTSMMAEFIKRFEGRELEDMDFYFFDENKRLAKYIKPYIEDKI